MNKLHFQPDEPLYTALNDAATKEGKSVPDLLTHIIQGYLGDELDDKNAKVREIKTELDLG